jgi:hypothetical protein
MELVAEWLSDPRRTYTSEPLVSDVRVEVPHTAWNSTADVSISFGPRDLGGESQRGERVHDSAAAATLVRIRLHPVLAASDVCKVVGSTD